MTEPKDIADDLAAALLEEWSIGTFLRFCDRPADFGSVEPAKLAEFCRQFLRDYISPTQH